MRSSPYTSTPLAGVLITARNRSCGKIRSVKPLLHSAQTFLIVSHFRGPVRFHDPGYSSAEHSVLYPLDEDLTNKLSSIQLSCEPHRSSQEPNADAQMSSGLSRLEISKSQ